MPTVTAPALQTSIEQRLRAWDEANGTRRLWSLDASLWTGREEYQWLGWLDAPLQTAAALGPIEAIAEDAGRGCRRVAVLGMGGSSLCPFVLAESFGPQRNAPQLHVLDSTDPAQVRALEAALDLPHAWFVVASKSGSTLEPNLMRDYFLARMREAVGEEHAAQHFLAITDPGSQLEAKARADGFRAVFLGEPTIGGRYSALSPFGIVPAALMGLDAGLLLRRAQAMATACRHDPAAENPGVRLGVTLGTAALAGRDKLTVVASPAIATLGAWLEQLVAESTGKGGKAIIPVDGEPLAAPRAYGGDRVFAYLRLEDAPDAAQDRAVAALERAGHPVIRLALEDRYDLAAQFFLWEFATAVAGAVIGVNPFDQPDVEAAKVETRRLMEEVEREGTLPADDAVRPGRALEPALRSLVGTLRPGDYFAVLAYLAMDAANVAALGRIRRAVRDRRRVATTVGFGPRFLHSTGQAHKGGPNTGVFLQLTADAAPDLPVPGRRYTFGLVEAAQARGDAAVLAQRGRRILRVHLGADVTAGLAAVEAAAVAALV
jgi:transaldolase/glucose-6-phosphate isomerase